MNGENGYELSLLSGNANPTLAGRIAEYLGTDLCPVYAGKFPDKEIDIQILESVRDKDVFIIQPTGNAPEINCSPNDNLVELLIMTRAAKQASARRVTAVIPYYGYARQDRKEKPHKAITARLIADCIVETGVDRVLLFDLHADQIEGFFDPKKIQIDHVHAESTIFVPHIRARNLGNAVIACTDAGGAKLMERFAERLGTDQALITKKRVNSETTKATNFQGETDGRTVIIVDDMISTAGSIMTGAETLKEQGAASIIVAATHGVLSGEALERIESAPIDEVWITDSLHHSPEKLPAKIKVLTASALLGESIRRIHMGGSIGDVLSGKFALPNLNPIKH